MVIGITSSVTPSKCKGKGTFGQIMEMERIDKYISKHSTLCIEFMFKEYFLYWKLYVLQLNGNISFCRKEYTLEKERFEYNCIFQYRKNNVLTKKKIDSIQFPVELIKSLDV